MNWPTAFLAAIGVFVRHAFKRDPVEETYEQRKQKVLSHNFLDRDE